MPKSWPDQQKCGWCLAATRKGWRGNDPSTIQAEHLDAPSLDIQRSSIRMHHRCNPVVWRISPTVYYRVGVIRIPAKLHIQLYIYIYIKYKKSKAEQSFLFFQKDLTCPSCGGCCLQYLMALPPESLRWSSHRPVPDLSRSLLRLRRSRRSRSCFSCLSCLSPLSPSLSLSFPFPAPSRFGRGFHDFMVIASLAVLLIKAWFYKQRWRFYQHRSQMWI